jgi:hypothetical protein
MSDMGIFHQLTTTGIEWWYIVEIDASKVLL